MESTSKSGQYLRIEESGGKIVSLAADATGSGQFQTALVAAGGSIGPVKTAKLDGKMLTIEPGSGDFVWELPFDAHGYYDADTHINYPSPYTTAGAYPLVLPIRKIVTSVGQILYIEHYKRLEKGRYFINLNVNDGSQLLLGGDSTQNYDLKVTFPGLTWIENEVLDDRLRLIAVNPKQPITIEVQPRGAEDVPSSKIIYPTVRFEPDFLVKYDGTGKQASASGLATDLMRMSLYWMPRITGGGDWGIGAVETAILNDPRSWHQKNVRAELLKQMGLVGYDRFEHFGMKFAWGKLPDYGAGGLLNVPPGNAPFDMRMLHLNGQWVQTVASYVLATGDVDVLKARSARWVATDGAEPQPICGEGKEKGKVSGLLQDYVLAAGDVRLDGKAPKLVHSLGQTFEAKAAFSSISIRLGTDNAPGGRRGRRDTGTSAATGIAVIRRTPDGEDLVRQPFSIEVGHEDYTLTITLPQKAEPGKYYVGITDDDSGKRYFGVGMYWWTNPESPYAGGDAYSGPWHGTVFDKLELLITYMRKYMGAEKEDLAYYINNPEYNIPDHKSGRHRVSMENSFWESPGGGYDMFEGLWYNAGCRSLAELATLMKRNDVAAKYADYAKRADTAFNKKYWHTVKENGQNVSRYYACEDWDGAVHDYGFTYYNLEAAARGIPNASQVRDLFRWLDRGYYSPDGGAFPQYITDWRKHLYSPWQIATPYNTIGTSSWLNITGTLPYFEVVANGGTRLVLTAPDLMLRAKVLSVDNMHERNKHVLARLASPDRLTGGRTFPDPGGRGRWHFGEPFNDKADIEGFREIFPTNGVLGPAEPMAYLGMEMTGKGMKLRPRVPSEVNRVSFDGLGYSGAVLNFSAEAKREEISTKTLENGGAMAASFTASAPFNKVGVRASVKPFKLRQDTQIELALDTWGSTGAWEQIGSIWYSHVQDDAWQWITMERTLDGSAKYRVRVVSTDAPEGEKLELQSQDGVPAVRLVSEKTLLRISPVYNPAKRAFTLTGGTAAESAGDGNLAATLGPGESTMLSSEIFR